MAALRAGKHVLVEKPMALDGAAARRMIAEAEQRRPNPHVRAGAALFPRVRGAAQCHARTRRGARRLLPPALRGSGMGRMAEGPCKERRRRFRPVDPRRGYVPASFRQAGSRFGRRVTATRLPAWTCCTVNCSIRSARWWCPGGWQHEGAFPFGMEYSVTLDGGTVEFSSAGRPPTLYSTDRTGAAAGRARMGTRRRSSILSSAAGQGGSRSAAFRGNRRMRWS